MSSAKKYNSLSYDEKLQLIDNEFQELHKYCMEKGFDQQTIKRCTQPLFDMVEEPRTKKWRRRLFVTGSILAVLVALIFVLPSFKLFWVFCRLAAIKMIPIFDWTDIINWDCAIDNPFFEATPYNEDNCKICNGLEEIGRFKASEVNSEIISDKYLKQNVPFILTDSMKEWPAQESFNAKFLLELYTNNPVLEDADVCMFLSNLKTKERTPQYVLDKIIRAKKTGYFMHWENCDTLASKELRAFYRRPEVIPPMVEIAPSNWVFIAEDYKGDNLKLIDVALPMMMYAQLKGEARISITARSPCNETCQVYSTILHPGEIAVVTDLMWVLHYTPLDNPETIAIATGGYFDY